MNWKEAKVSGWGRSSWATVHACRPERLSAAARAVAERPAGGLIAFGGGRSYGDAALGDQGHVMLTERLDRILAFDGTTAELICEPGVRIRDLQEFLLAKGFMLPSVPGTGYATIGGAVANDVHGKNHDHHGSIGDHLCWFDLLYADGEIRHVSPDADADLFAATIGGLGLTGILVTLCLNVLPAPSNAVQVSEYRVRNLDHFFELFDEHRAHATYSVGWIDGLARGDRLGRGILEIADPLTENIAVNQPRRRRMPCDLPSFVLNRWSIGLFNEFYYRRIPRAGRQRRLPFEQFFHPLDAILDWNRLYGRGGFHQFQCVLPEPDGADGIRRLLEAISQSGAASFLAVLKTMGGGGRGHLSFPMRGYTLALDFPTRPGVLDLLARLEAITLEHSGRVYLAKDSCLSAEGFARMYPALPDFRAVLSRVDPEGLFGSDLSRRLDIRGPAA